MIPLRPTINLYYDKIIDGTPIPNGVENYDYTRDKFRIPFAINKDSPVNEVTSLYNVMKVLEVPRLNILTGKETAPNLFYPLELAPGRKWDVDLLTVIPEKSLNRIRKEKMKLLIFAPRLSHDYKVMWKLRERLDYLGSKGITKDMIYIVLGDINGTYRGLFDNNNVYGIDWWQIYAQISYKSRYSLESWHWVFKERPSTRITEQEFEYEDFKFENWNPKRIFTALTGNTAIHNTAFISELIYRDLDKFGEYSYNLEGYSKAKDYTDFRITDKRRGEEYILAKKEIIERISSTIKKLDIDHTMLTIDPLKINAKIFEDSLINIVSGSFSPMFDQHYMNETGVISPGLGVWRQIAKGHPFMVLGCLNTMGYIGNEGYFLPTQLTSHFYDRVSKTPDKVNLMCDNIERLSQMSSQEITDLASEMLPFMKKNKEKFFNKPNYRKFEKLFSEMVYE